MPQGVVTALHELADPERVAFAQRTCPTALRVNRSHQPEPTAGTAKLKQNTKKLSAEQVIDSAHPLVQCEVFEVRWLAYELPGSGKKTLRALGKIRHRCLNTIDR